MTAPAHWHSNIEIKARLRDLPAAREVAEAVMTSRLAEQWQRDTYFECRQGRLKLREINDEQAELIAYERADAGHSRASWYTITPIADPESFRAAMKSALGVRVTVEKQRAIYLYHNVRIHLDEVAELGSYLEFEAVLGEDIPPSQGHEQIAMLRQKFAIYDEDVVAVSYADLLLEK